MQIIISKPINVEFVYYIKDYVKDLCLNSINEKKLGSLNKEYNIDFKEVVKKALDSLIVRENPTCFMIKFDKSAKYKGKNIDSLMNLLNYGSRSCKGYPIIEKVFNFVVDKIDILYRRWGEECQ